MAAQTSTHAQAARPRVCVRPYGLPCASDARWPKGRERLYVLAGRRAASVYMCSLAEGPRASICLSGRRAASSRCARWPNGRVHALLLPKGFSLYLLYIYCEARPYLYQTSAAKRTSRGLQVYFSEFTKVDLRFLYLDTSKTYQKLSFSNFF